METLSQEHVQVLDNILSKRGTKSDKAVIVLQDMQAAFGFVPVTAMKYIAEHSEITPRQMYGIATFYAQFRLNPVGKHIIKVCHGTACHVRGAEMVDAALEEYFGVKMGETTPDNNYTIESVACLGCCSLAPVMMIDDTTVGHLDRAAVRKAVKRHQDEVAK